MPDSDLLKDFKLKTPYFGTIRRHTVKTLIKGLSKATRILIERFSLGS